LNTAKFQQKSEQNLWTETVSPTNYSRTVPVEISHPKGERPVRGFAIIDDQSTMTMIDPSAVEEMGLPNKVLFPTALTTTTVQGTSYPERCVALKGLQVAPINQAWDRIDLPSTYVKAAFSQLRPEVPTSSQVANLPGFEHLAEEFLPNLADLNTVILIGRNCIAAQKQKQFTSSRNEHQIASETPLGWCIMGKPPYRSIQRTYNSRSFLPSKQDRRKQSRESKKQRKKARILRAQRRRRDQRVRSRLNQVSMDPSVRPLMDITFSNLQF